MCTDFCFFPYIFIHIQYYLFLFWSVIALIEYFKQHGGTVRIDYAAASGIFTRCIFKSNTGQVSEVQLKKIFHSRHLNKDHWVQYIPNKTRSNYSVSLMAVHPLLSIIFIYHIAFIDFDILIEILLMHQLIIVFRSSLPVTFSNVIPISSYFMCISSYTMLTHTFVYIQFICLFLCSLFHLWTVGWCSVHHKRFWYIYNMLLHWQYSYLLRWWGVHRWYCFWYIY